MKVHFASHRSQGIFFAIVALGILLPILSRVPPFGALQSVNAWTNAFTIAVIYSILAIGLNVVIGFAGLLDLGYAAFFALGGYTYALVASPFLNIHLPFWPVLIIGAIIGAIFGILLGAPTLRLRGDYLAIVTLGLGEIVSILATSKWAEPLVGGPQGMRGVTKAQFLGLNPQDVPQHFYYLALIFVVFAFFVSRRLANSRIGRAWNAMREGRLALMTPVMTFTDGRWVAMMRWMPTARAICAMRQMLFSTSRAATIMRSLSSSTTMRMNGRRS